MSLLHWNQKLSVGVLEMDYQHCELVEMVNDLHDAIKRGRRAEKLKPMVERLIGHTVDHFRDEEEYMKSIGFPGLEAHKRTHEKLVAEVQERYRRFQQGGTGAPKELLEFLLDWVATHIQTEDIKYGEYAQMHQVASVK